MIKIFSMMEDSRFSDFTDVLGYLNDAVVLNCGDIRYAESRCSVYRPSVISLDEENAALLPNFTALLRWTSCRTGTVELETCKGLFRLTLAVGEDCSEYFPETLFGRRMRASEFLIRIREYAKKVRKQDKISKVRNFSAKSDCFPIWSVTIIFSTPWGRR